MTTPPASATPPKPANSNKPCPICGKPAQERTRPFCSPRCAELDLHRWLGGVYRVETEEGPDTPGVSDEA